MPDVTGPQQCWRNLSLLSFASRWIYAWRSLDIEVISSLVSADVEFHFGTVSDSEPVRSADHLASALRQPGFLWDLKDAAHLTGLITGENVLVIDYQDDAGSSFTETLMFRKGLVHWRQIELDVFTSDPRIPLPPA